MGSADEGEKYGRREDDLGWGPEWVNKTHIALSLAVLSVTAVAGIVAFSVQDIAPIANAPERANAAGDRADEALEKADSALRVATEALQLIRRTNQTMRVGFCANFEIGPWAASRLECDDLAQGRMDTISASSDSRGGEASSSALPDEGLIPGALAQGAPPPPDALSKCESDASAALAFIVRASRGDFPPADSVALCKGVPQ